VNERYLWDRSDPVDEDIARIETALAALRSAATPVLVLPPPAARRRGTFGVITAIAASAVLALGGLVWMHRADGPALAVTSIEGTPRIASTAMAAQGALAAGHWLETDAAARASIAVGDIGRVDVDPRTRIGLVGSRDGTYRLRLDRGTMHALIWAPPGRFFVDTPSSTAVDLGCAYTLTVDDQGSGLLRVTSGWVGFEWRGRESFIPAGAVCPTRRDLGPGTPRYEDTSQPFRSALDAIDAGESPDAVTAALDLVLAEARERDVVTLWHLLTRVPPGDRDRVFDRLAGFVPPPGDVTHDGIRLGRRDMLDRWWDQLGLGTASWWRTWKQPWRAGAGAGAGADQ
jgi:hypothetical protein